MCYSLSCNAPLQGGHILAHFKVEVIKQPSDNNFDKIFAQIQVSLNNPWPNAHIHDYTSQSTSLSPPVLPLGGRTSDPQK